MTSTTAAASKPLMFIAVHQRAPEELDAVALDGGHA